MPWMPAGLVPNGTVCCSRYGDWGVMVGWRSRRQLDRWHGGRIGLELLEPVHVPVESLVPLERVRPMGRGILPRVQDYVQNQTVLSKSGAGSGRLQPKSRPESFEES